MESTRDSGESGANAAGGLRLAVMTGHHDVKADRGSFEGRSADGGKYDREEATNDGTHHGQQTKEAREARKGKRSKGTLEGRRRGKMQDTKAYLDTLCQIRRQMAKELEKLTARLTTFEKLLDKITMAQATGKDTLNPESIEKDMKDLTDAFNPTGAQLANDADVLVAGGKR